MASWEYTMVVATWNPKKAIKIHEPGNERMWDGSLIEALNLLGSQRWEVVSHAVDSTGEGPGVDIILLKRGTS